ncbi:MAG TPA: hypothetical protein VGM74_22780 [Burkholderiaceae bacterium]|jgi:hypothetical protein
MEKTADQMYGDLLLQLGNPTILEPEALVGYLRDVETMYSRGRITSSQLGRARKAYEATIRRDPRQAPPGAAGRVVGDLHTDPISGAPGAHPVGTGIGAAAGGAIAGAAIGASAGPVGAVIGVAVGAVVGGLAGKGVAEMIDPTGEETYWRANYASRPYVASGANYDDYGPAYVHGADARRRFPDREFDDVDSELARDWQRARSTSSLDWDAARPASRDAWHRAEGGDPFAGVVPPSANRRDERG